MNPDELRRTSPAFYNFNAPRGTENNIVYHVDQEEEGESDNERRIQNKRKKKANNEAPPLNLNYAQPGMYQAMPMQMQPGMPMMPVQPMVQPMPNQSMMSATGYPMMSPTKGQDDETASVFRGNEENSPEKLMSPTKQTERMVTSQKLIRKNSLLNSRSLDNEYKIANYALAEEFFNKMAYRKKTAEGYEEYSACGDDNGQFKKYGLGMYLYLQFMKQFGFFFLIASTIACINMVYNYTSTGLTGYPSSFSLTLSKTTLGNNDVQTEQQLFIQSIISGVVSLCLIIFVLHWRKFCNDVVNESLETHTDIDSEKYILAFSGFNRADLDTAKIKRFLEKSYPIYEVSVIYDYYRRFEDFKDIEELKHDIEAARVKALANNEECKDLPEMNEKLEKEYMQLLQSQPARVPMYLIVHFQRISDCVAYESLYTKRHLINSFGQKFLKCFTCTDNLPINYRYDPNDQWLIERVKLGKPEDIIWENVDVTTCNWIVRRIIGIILLIISLFITSGLICISTLYIATTSSCSDYTTITFAQAQVTTDQNTLFCYCQEQIFSGFMDDSIKSLCQNLNQKIIITNALQISASVVSAITNVILSVLIVQIVKMMKPKSKSSMYTNIFIINFIAVLLNSIVLPLLINASIFGTKPVLYISFLNFLDLTKISMYSDFQKAWYVYIAPYYINMIIISIIMPLIDIIKTSILRCIKRSSLEGKSGQILQKEMNESITDYEFDLPVKLSNTLVNIFLVMTYSTNIPILLPLMALSLCINFYCNKAMILKFSHRIVANEELSFELIKIFPWILVINVGFALWSLTCPEIFPEALFQRLRLKFFTIGTIDRALYINFLTAMLVIAILYLVLDYTVVTFFKAICVCECVRPATVAPINGQLPYSELIKKENIINSYRMGKNPKYAAVSKVIEEVFSTKYQQLSNTSMQA